MKPLASENPNDTHSLAAVSTPCFWNPSELLRLRDLYRNGLLEDSVPFWFPRAIDKEYGGYFTCLDRDGSLLQEDKSVWFQGRMAWMLATLYLTVEQRPEWLEAARSGVEFLTQHCFDIDGRMFYSVTREGKPLRKRRYLFSECFAIIAFAAYGKAAGDDALLRRAEALFDQVLYYYRTPGSLPAKVDPETRPGKGLAMPMILLVTAQELRKHSGYAQCDAVIDASIHEIAEDFMKPEFQCVLEAVGPQGEFMDTLDGRCVNPGHSLEAGWFILHEARLRGNDAKLIKLGTTIIDWSLELGWDKEFGGILYFRDAKGLPCTEYWHDMKFWWPHNETIIATLLAYHVTGDIKYAEWHDKVREWSYQRFPDSEEGEWYGYLHRDGRLSTRVKGTMYKGFFHLPRMQWYCWQVLEEMLKDQA